MKYFRDNQGNVFAYDDTQMDLVEDKTTMTDEEVESHINPVLSEQELLAIQVAEAKQYLSATDYKMTVDYDQDVTDIKVKRAEAREFIRANQ